MRKNILFINMIIVLLTINSVCLAKSGACFIYTHTKSQGYAKCFDELSSERCVARFEWMKQKDKHKDSQIFFEWLPNQRCNETRPKYLRGN